MVYAERGGIGHAPNQATGTKATALAGKGYNPAVSTLATPDTEKTMGRDPTTKKGFHLVASDEAGNLSLATTTDGKDKA